jgi:nicotinate-nucleotide pyrophosphorylase (carboxylating)
MSALDPPDAATLERLVGIALAEDAPWGDITSDSLLAAETKLSANLMAREDGVQAGIQLFATAMRLVDPTTQVIVRVEDGQTFTPGTILASVTGSARAVLKAERVGLNFMQRLSGIATLTAQYVAAAAGTGARIVDTRKTTPGLRVLERYAVRCGGGRNHRFSLSDAVLVKDNHLAAVLASGTQTVTDALKALRHRIPHTMHVEVEVDRLDQIDAVLAAGVDTIMLDNFSLEDLRRGVDQIAGRALVEASGGVRLERIAQIAATGVDIISVGALTHSVRSLDLGLDFTSSAAVPAP